MKPALILIDIQQGFEEPYWGERNNPDFEENISTLLAYWREKNEPVIHVKHNSTRFIFPKEIWCHISNANRNLIK